MNVKRKSRSALTMQIPLIIVFLLSMGMFAWTAFSCKTQVSTVYADSSHNHDGYTEWDQSTYLPDSAGSYYLTADVTISSTWNVPSGTTNLCLNGHGIKKTGGTVIYVNGGTTLNIYDCGTITHYFDVDSDNCATDIDETAGDGRKSFTGGYITGGNVTEGGGITVSGGTLNLYGGVICGNKATGSVSDGIKAGAVYLKNSARFTMTGGEISYNYSARQGGAICTDASAVTVELSGGEIKCNKAAKWGSAIWAGRANGSRLTICGDVKIIDNISQSGEASVNVADTRNYIISGDPTIEGKSGTGSTLNAHLNLDKGSTTALKQFLELNGVLTNDTGIPKITISAIGSNLSAGNTIVFTKNWNAFMGSADPSKYFKLDASVTNAKVVRKNGEAAVAPSGDKYITFDANGGDGNMDSQLVTGSSADLNENTFTYYGYSFAGWNTQADGTGTPYENGVNVTLSGDVTLYAQWVKAHAHDDVTFKAWTYTDSLPTSGNYYLTDNVTVSSQTIVPSGNVVNLCLNGYSVTNAVSRIYLVENGGTLHVYDNAGSGSMRGEKLNNNYDSSIGTVVRVAKGGYFELHSGTLYGSSTPGKGFFTVLTNGEFKMSGGMITEEQDQFAVQAEGVDSVFRMTGGVITNCKGGGVHVYGGTAYISGGTISDNGENRDFGGILLLSDYATSALFLSGDPTIVNNTNKSGVACNVNLYGTKTITLDGALMNATSIGVTRTQGVFTNGWSTYMEDEDPADHFTSDNASYEIRLSDKEAYVGVHVHDWTYTVDGNVITATCAGVEKGTCNFSDQTLTINVANKTYDGTAVAATLVKSEGWTAANGLPENIAISYSGNTNAGTYTASITVGEKTAFAEFTIEKKVETVGPDSSDVKVDGLDEEVQKIITENPSINSVSVAMKVENKTEETAANSEDIQIIAKHQSLQFFEIKVEQTLDEVTTVLDTTANVLEIAISYEKATKRGITVYSYHDSQVRTFVEDDTKEDGTFRVDKENKLVYIYANKFSTYAIGYTPYYRVQTSLSLGSYTGKATVTIKNNADENIEFTSESADAKNIVFPDVPKGQYTMTVTWEDGKTNALTMTLSVGPKAVLSAITEQVPESEDDDSQSEPLKAQTYPANFDTPDGSDILPENVKTETGVIVDGENETSALEQVSVVGKGQKANNEIGFISRKREYAIKNEYAL